MSNQWWTGIIDSVKKDYGFIISETGESIFYHQSNVLEKEILREKYKVKFNTKSGKKGLEAINISIIEKPESLSDYFLRVVIDLDKTDYDVFCDKVLEYAEELKAGELSTSQIRKVYSLLIHADTVQQAKVLRPQLAYTAGRNKETKNLMLLLDALIKKVSNEKQLEYVKTFLEATVAYLKYVGAKEHSK